MTILDGQTGQKYVLLQTLGGHKSGGLGLLMVKKSQEMLLIPSAPRLKGTSHPSLGHLPGKLLEDSVVSDLRESALPGL